MTAFNKTLVKSIFRVVGGLVLIAIIQGCSGTNEKLVIPQEATEFSDAPEETQFLRESLGLDENLKPVDPPSK